MAILKKKKIGISRLVGRYHCRHCKMRNRIGGTGNVVIAILPLLRLKSGFLENHFAIQENQRITSQFKKYPPPLETINWRFPMLKFMRAESYKFS